MVILIVCLHDNNVECFWYKLWVQKVKSILCAQVVAYTISLLWCLIIVGNQIDYATKPWMEERKEVRQKNYIINNIIIKKNFSL